MIQEVFVNCSRQPATPCFDVIFFITSCFYALFFNTFNLYASIAVTYLAFDNGHRDQISANCSFAHLSNKKTALP